jgi:hypothetical protein
VRYYLPGLPPQTAEKIAAAMQRPEGTAEFWGTYPGLLDPSMGTGVLLEVITGEVIFVLIREPNLLLSFLHATPGLGTRRAVVDLKTLLRPPACERFFLALVWSQNEMRLHVGRGDGGQLATGLGETAPFSIQVAPDGTVLQTGGPGVTVMGARLYANGGEMLSPPAIKVWEDTHVAAKTLLSGQSSVGYLFEVVSANAILAALVTGFETYAQKRFVELEGEGIHPNIDALIREFVPKPERERPADGSPSAFEKRVAAEGRSPLRILADRINFQSYANTKRAFNRGYGIKLGELASITAQDLDRLQRLIEYRHRVIHISPLLGILNGPECPPEEPFFSNRSSAELAISTFETVIKALHKSTLELRPTETDG